MNARELAMHILCEIDYNGAYSNIALKEHLNNSELSAVDKSFVTRLVYGVVSRRITIDYIISKYSKIKIKKMSKYVAELLRIAIYQMLYCDKIPDSAAVNESVKLSYKYANKSRGFINGVLRSFERDGKVISYPEDSIKAMSVKFSFPESICKKWSDEFGIDRAEKIMDRLNTEPETVLRINRLKTDIDTVLKMLSEQGINNTRDKLCQDSIMVTGMNIASNSLFTDGLVSVQDSAASLAVKVLDPKEGETVFDMCSAPGGKCSYAAELMSDKGNISAFDIYEHKINLINENSKRLGIKIINASIMDASEYNPDLCEKADKIIADVPCSGFGIIRRKPDIKYNMENRTQICDLQLKILQNCSRYLKHGGEMVYSTCTFESAENEQVIEKFISQNNEFECVDITRYIPIEKDSTKNGYITLYPDIDECDGFFICKLHRK